jgi:hypothetical protein
MPMDQSTQDPLNESRHQYMAKFLIQVQTAKVKSSFCKARTFLSSLMGFPNIDLNVNNIDELVSSGEKWEDYDIYALPIAIQLKQKGTWEIILQ